VVFRDRASRRALEEPNVLTTRFLFRCGVRRRMWKGSAVFRRHFKSASGWPQVFRWIAARLLCRAGAARRCTGADRTDPRAL